LSVARFKSEDNRALSRDIYVKSRENRQFLGHTFKRRNTANSGRAFSIRAHLRTCDKVGLTRVQWPPCEYDGNGCHV